MNAPIRHGRHSPRPNIRWQTLTNAANKLYSQGNLDGAQALYRAAKAEADRCIARARIQVDDDPDLCALAPMMVVISCQNLAECAAGRGQLHEAEAEHRYACLTMLDIIENDALATTLRSAAARHLKPALSDFATWLQQSGRGPTGLAAIVSRGQRFLSASTAQREITRH